MTRHEADNPTRFHPPALSRNSVVRQAFLLLVSKLPPKKLTTIVAPPGYGKTSAAAQWHAALKEQGTKTVWITLEQEDSDLAHFVPSILEGLSGLVGDVSPGLDPSEMSAPSVEAILITRLRRIQETVVLFLDDFNFAQTSGNVGLMHRLLHSRALLHIKFVLVSRFAFQIPVSALSLDDQLRHIKESDLAFSNSEAQEFFDSSPIRLDHDEVKSLNQRTEGWAVALQMIRTLIGDNIDHASILASLDGGNTEMGRYLSEQVFGALPENVRCLLTKTAKLPELCRELAAAVTDEPGVFETYSMLSEYPLPVVSLDKQGKWIRYHPVFGSFLREEGERQGMDSTSVIKRAALWFQGKGDIESAVKHALLANDATLAARIVEGSGGWRCVYATNKGGSRILRSLVSRSRDIELADYPLTTLGFAVISAKEGRLASATHYLSIVDGALKFRSKALSIDMRVVTALLNLYTDRALNDAELTQLESDLSEWETSELVRRALLLNMLCYNFLQHADTKRALHYGHLAIQCFQDGGANYGALHLYTHIGQAALFSGDPATAEGSYLSLMEEAQTHIGKGTDLDAIGHVLCNEVQALRGDIDVAAEGLKWALPHIAKHDAWFDLLASGVMAEQMVYRLSGDFTSAHAAIDTARVVARRRGLERLERLVERASIDLLIASGEVDEAVRLCHQAGYASQGARELRSNDFAAFLRGPVPGILWIRIHLARGEYIDARNLLDRIVTLQHRPPTVPRQIELAALDIRLMLAEGRQEDAVKRLTELLSRLPVVDYRAIFLMEGGDFREKVTGLYRSSNLPVPIQQRIQLIFLSPSLSISSETTVAKVAPPTNPHSELTAREISVVQLLGLGLSNKEIAKKLFLTENTVKYHLRNIYTKLNVSNRTGAVTAARSFGLAT